VGLVAKSSDTELVLRSPEFLDHLLGTHEPSGFHLATIRDADGSILGVVPLRVARSCLAFDVAGHVLAGSRSNQVQILGSVPLQPADPLLHDSLFAALDVGFEDCQAIAMSGVPTASFLWHHVHQSRYLKERFLPYAMHGVRECHFIPLPATAGAYWAKFSAKRRYNFKRQTRMLRDRFGGRLELRRFDSPHQIGDLIDLMTPTVKFAGLRSWNGKAVTIDRREAESLADRGLLLIYLVIGAGRPCAALMGLKYQGVYYVDEIPRDHSLDRFSPGATAVQLAIEDLIQHTSIRKIDMGSGTPAYRHSSTNVTEPRASLLLLRRTLANRLLARTHAMFNSLLDVGRACIERSARRRTQ
jgi:CelD/BcsL family acetyltransferase involved in cellulose biosynthesis